jgi:putative thioredoxin
MSDILFSKSGNGAPSGDLVKDTTTATFMQDVVEASREVPVLVDFWAPWCGPCRQLTPVLEKVVRAARGTVKLVKMNIDEHPQIAGQLGVQSIPAVFAFKNGQPVDGFMGALPESQVKAFIERLNGGEPLSAADELLPQAEALMQEGAVGEAARYFAAVLQEEPQNPRALGGMARAFIQLGELAQARHTLALVAPEHANDAAVAGARAALELAEQSEKLGDPRALEARLERDPADHQARFDLALIRNARGDRAGAAEALLEIVRRERNWNDEAARKQLLQFFEAWGAKDPASQSGRRKLSSLLFS